MSTSPDRSYAARDLLRRARQARTSGDMAEARRCLRGAAGLRYWLMTPGMRQAHDLEVLRHRLTSRNH